MKKIFFLFSIIVSSLISLAQNDTTKLIIKTLPLDYQYQQKARQVYNIADIFFSPSMQQSLDITASAYNLTFYALDKINWDRIKNPWLRPFAQALGFYIATIGLTYLPFGDSWLHEEFHRSVLTYHLIKSHDQVYDFPIFSSLISVNDIKDSDLIRFKASDATDFIRLPEAGIEGEYLLINRLNELSFFNSQDYPYYIPEILITMNSFYYVWFCHTQQAQTTTEELNAKETNIKERDFTGLDFTAWVYDLFRPNEPYSARGIHPSGYGIDRYIKPSDLSNKELSYLKRQGYMQLVNFVSPFLFNINGFKLGKIKYNFAFRYFLTSFGSDFVLYNYIQHNKLNFVIGSHFYKNYHNLFTGIELLINGLDLISNNILLNADLQVFTQPKDLSFTTTKSMLGISSNLELNIRLSKRAYISLNLLGKTKGWVPGVVEQSKAINLLGGLSWRL